VAVLSSIDKFRYADYNVVEHRCSTKLPHDYSYRAIADGRYRLVITLSEDEGKRWPFMQTIEDSED